MVLCGPSHSAHMYTGTHPEMIHLQTELQNRHDKRLELAAKKRKYEDDHVTMMRKGDEDAIWGWWKVCTFEYTSTTQVLVQLTTCYSSKRKSFETKCMQTLIGRKGDLSAKNASWNVLILVRQ